MTVLLPIFFVELLQQGFVQGSGVDAMPWKLQFEEGFHDLLIILLGSGALSKLSAPLFLHSREIGSCL